MIQVLVAISQKFCNREEIWAMQKLFIKKEKVEKMDKCSRYLKQWVLRYLPEKRKEMNKISNDLLQSIFKFQKRDIFSRSIVELG
jgi:hypothetical protein